MLRDVEGAIPYDYLVHFPLNATAPSPYNIAKFIIQLHINKSNFIICHTKSTAVVPPHQKAARLLNRQMRLGVFGLQGTSKLAETVVSVREQLTVGFEDAYRMDEIVSQAVEKLLGSDISVVDDSLSHTEG